MFLIKLTHFTRIFEKTLGGSITLLRPSLSKKRQFFYDARSFTSSLRNHHLQHQ